LRIPFCKKIAYNISITQIEGGVMVEVTRVTAIQLNPTRTTDNNRPPDLFCLQALEYRKL